MKKKLALLLVLSMMLGLTACGAKEEAAEASADGEVQLLR